MALTTPDLASRAARLSNELHVLQERCDHNSTSSEISSIADELARLSTTLYHLHEAMNADPYQYTTAFNQDLAEITTELTLVLEEISECCSDMQKTDPLDSPVPWFFMKGRVARLTKHLEALKGTLAVMRTVLWHGRECGIQSAGKTHRGGPQTLQEDRIILESLLARNRNTILDLHKLDPSTTADTTGVNHVDTFKHNNLGLVNDQHVSGFDRIPSTAAGVQEDKLERTFSKRGVRLGVHMSILDLNALEAPMGLKQKWIQQSRLRSKGEQTSSSEQRGHLTALPELSRISEAETTASPANTTESSAQQSLNLSPVSSMVVEPSESSIASPEHEPQRRSIDHSSIGKSIKKAMRRLSITGIRAQSGKKKQRDAIQAPEVTHDISTRSPDENESPQQLCHETESTNNTKKPRFIQVVSKPFQPNSPLNTPDVEREFENGALG